MQENTSVTEVLSHSREKSGRFEPLRYLSTVPVIMEAPRHNEDSLLTGFLTLITTQKAHLVVLSL